MAVKKVLIDLLQQGDPFHTGRLRPGHIGPGRRRTRASRRALEWRKHFSIFYRSGL